MSLERLEALRPEMKKCVRCSLCKLVPLPTIQDTRFTSGCPPVDEYHFHAYSGGGIQIMALSLLDGRIEINDDLAQIVSACTTCGLCDVACKYIMAAERMGVIIALKEHLVNSGQILPEQQALLDNLQRYGHTAGRPDPVLGDWARGLEIKKVPDEKAAVLLYAGTGAAHDAQQATNARMLALLLKKAGVDFAILDGGEPDSGIELYWTGQRKTFEEQAEKVLALLNGTGVSTIVTLCGEDLGMLRAKYPAIGRAPQARVQHASEFLLALIQKGALKLTRPIQQKVTYHDPCYLGRQSERPQPWQGEECRTHGVKTYFVPPKAINYGTNGVFDAPRQILHLIPGLEFAEMQRIREYAYCCGGGGGVPETHPNVARTAALHRIDEAAATGAQTLVTACRHCRHSLLRWQKDKAMPVKDIIEMVFEATGLDAGGMAG